MAKFGFLGDPAPDGFELQPEDRIVVQKYTVEEAGTLLALFAYIRGGESAEGGGVELPAVRGVVYADNNGEPDALLDVSSVDAPISTEQAEKWETCLFETGLELAAGTYWIGLHIKAYGSVSSYVEVGYQDATGVRRYATDVQSDGSPAVWPVATDTADTVELSIFAEYVPASQVYDEQIHHIGLGYDGVETKYGFLLDGAYRKDVQQDSTPQEFGSERDDIERVPSLSRWSQDNFLGGQYALTYSEDNKQFAECENFLPSQSGRSLIGVAPLTDLVTGALGEVDEEPKLFVSWAQWVWRVSSERLQQFDLQTVGIDNTIVAGAGVSFQAACFDAATRRIFVLEQNDAGTATTLKAVNPATAAVTTVDTAPNPPGWNPAKGLVSDNAGNLYGVFGEGGQLWRIKPNDDLTNATWTKITKLPESYQDAVAYNGYVYILCGDADQRTVLLVFDGTNLNTLVEIPFNFIGKCLTVYGGRIYVGGTGLDIDGNNAYGELYEINGSSLRLVRTFSPFRANAAQDFILGSCKSIEDLHVHEGLLWLATPGLGRLEVYDQTTDAFYGGPELDSISSTNLEPLALTTARGRLACWVRDPGGSEDGVWTVTYDELQLENGNFIPKFYLSFFDPLPAVEKRWSKIVVRSRGEAPNSIFTYDPDTGTGTSSGVEIWSEGGYHFAQRDLSGLSPSKGLQISLWWFISDLSVMPELVSFTLEFAFLDSGKHAWSLTVAVPSDIEGVDGALISQNVSATVETLEDWQGNRQPLVYTDVDGREYNTFIRDISVVRPIVGPKIDGGAPEALVNLVLLEV